MRRTARLATGLLSLAILSSSFLSATTSDTKALSCLANFDYYGYDAVFAGKVTNVNPSKSNSGLFSYIQTIDPSTVYQGDIDPNINLQVYSDELSAQWGYKVEAGKEYLVFVDRREDGKYYFNLCNPTALLSDSQQVIKNHFSTTINIPNDIQKNPYKWHIIRLMEKGYLQGYGDGTFRPDDSMNRGEMSAFIVNALQLPIDASGTPFPDAKPGENKFASYIQTLRNKGIIHGYSSGLYRSDEKVTKGQVAKYVVNSLRAKGISIQNSPSVDGPQDFYGHIFEKEIMALLFYTNKSDLPVYTLNPYGQDPMVSFGPNKLMTRGEMASIVNLARDFKYPSDVCARIGGTYNNGQCDGLDQLTCEGNGGQFDECGSACGINSTSEVCVMMCKQTCYLPGMGANKCTQAGGTGTTSQCQLDHNTCTAKGGKAICLGTCADGMMCAQMCKMGCDLSQ